jgi:hypothetical protein
MSAPSTRRHRLARVAAAIQVSLILWGWALAQDPYVEPPALTIGESDSMKARNREMIQPTYLLPEPERSQIHAACI